MSKKKSVVASAVHSFIEQLENRTLLTTYSMQLAPSQPSQVVTVDLSKDGQTANVSFLATTTFAASGNDPGDHITQVNLQLSTDGGVVVPGSVGATGLVASSDGSAFTSPGTSQNPGGYEIHEQIKWDNANRGVRHVSVVGTIATLTKGSKTYNASETITIPAGDISMPGVDNSNENTDGVQFAVNNDDDNADGTPDNHNDFTAGENDLIPLTLAASGAGGEYQLDFIDSGVNQAIKIWAKPDKSADDGTAHIVGGTNGTNTYRIGSDHTILDASQATTVYVEGFSLGTDTLSLKWKSDVVNAPYNVADTIKINVPLPAPNGLIATEAGSSLASLSWSYHSSLADGFNIVRSDDSGTTWTMIGSTSAGQQTYDAAVASWTPDPLFEVRAYAGSAAAPTAISDATPPTNVDPATPIIIQQPQNPATHVTDDTIGLNILGSVPRGEQYLNYTWGAIETPDDAPIPTFSDNGTNAGKSTTVTFFKAGTYTFQATIDNNEASVVSDPVTVIVDQTYTSIQINPEEIDPEQSPETGLTAASAVELDQFADPMANQPDSFDWSSDSGAVSTLDGFHDTGDQLEAGDTDPYWMVDGAPAVVTDRNPLWIYNQDQTSNWISFAEDSNEDTTDGPGQHTYATLVTVTNGSMSLSGSVAADDSVQDIVVNGQSTGLSFDGASTTHDFTLGATDGLISGINTIQFVVQNNQQTGDNQTGLLVHWNSPDNQNQNFLQLTVPGAPKSNVVFQSASQGVHTAAITASAGGITSTQSIEISGWRTRGLVSFSGDTITIGQLALRPTSLDAASLELPKASSYIIRWYESFAGGDVVFDGTARDGLFNISVDDQAFKLWPVNTLPDNDAVYLSSSGLPNIAGYASFAAVFQGNPNDDNYFNLTFDRRLAHFDKEVYQLKIISIELPDITPDLTVDSNNDGHIDNSDNAHEATATLPGVRIPLNDDDDNKDGKADWSEDKDTEVAHENDLVPMYIEPSSEMTDGTLTLSVNDPSHIRVWDSAGHLLLGHAFHKAITWAFGRQPSEVFIEGIGAASAKLADVAFTLSATRAGDTRPTGTDVARGTVIAEDVLIGADNGNDDSLNDDWVGAAQGSTTNTIKNYVRVKGPAGMTLSAKISVLPPTRGGGTVNLLGSLTATDPIPFMSRTITIGSNGVGTTPFFIQGLNHSATPDDVTVAADFSGGQQSLQTLTVIKFNAEAETAGNNVIPVNPAAVSSRALLWQGNLFGTDVRDQNIINNELAHSSDVPYTEPSLGKSKKFNYSQIEVAWARVFNGTLMLSSDANSTLKRPAGASNGTTPGTLDNLRMRDLGITTQMEAHGGQVVYYLLHPTESGLTATSLDANRAASITTNVIPTKIYPVNFNVMQWVAAVNHQVLGTLPISVTDIAQVQKTANTILSQASIELAPQDSVFLNRQTSTVGEYDVSDGVFGTLDNLVHDYASTAIDVDFVRGINNGNASGSTQYTGMVSSHDLYRYADPGIALATYDNPSVFNGGKTPNSPAVVRPPTEMGRSLAHEMMHYLLKSSNDVGQTWNIFYESTSEYKRDINHDQILAMYNAGVSTTNPDQ